MPVTEAGDQQTDDFITYWAATSGAERANFLGLGRGDGRAVTASVLKVIADIARTFSPGKTIEKHVTVTRASPPRRPRSTANGETFTPPRVAQSLIV